MPETLPELLALWASTYPEECRALRGSFVLTQFNGLETAVVPGRGFDNYIIEGHARDCIERAGWFHLTRSLPSGREDGEGVLYVAWAEDAGDHRRNVDAPSLQGQHAPTCVLVTLRLLLPPRSTL